MLLAEVDHMSWLVFRLLQVPNLEVLRLVDGEELTDTGRELRLVRVGCQHHLVFLPVFVLRLSFVEVEKAPFQRCDSSLTLLVPNC